MIYNGLRRRILLKVYKCRSHGLVGRVLADRVRGPGFESRYGGPFSFFRRTQARSGTRYSTLLIIFIISA